MEPQKIFPYELDNHPKFDFLFKTFLNNQKLYVSYLQNKI